MSAEYEDLEARFRRFGTQDAGGRSASRTRLVVGIDFGTTYTGVAYSHTADDNMSDITDWTLEQIRDKIVAIKQWPNADPLYPEKAPTVLAYQNGAVVAWGGSVKPSHPLRVAHFKLGLQESVAQHYSSSSTIGAAISILGGFLNDHKWRHPELPRKQPVDFAADYLKAIREYVLESALTRHLGKEFLHNQPIQYVITVPAIWSDKAKDLTRKAATRAGIPENDLSLVTEPEAAALYCSTLCNEVNLNDGDRFLICDAGGGTVDLISYEIITKRPFRIKECTAGTGGACGAVYLTRNFENFLSKRLGSRRDALTPKMLSNAVKAFEGAIKFQFDPFDDDCDTEYEIPLRGAPNIPSIGLEEGYLKVSKYVSSPSESKERNELMQSVFVPGFSKISDLVQDQIRKVESTYKAGIKVLFLVGGLGSNVFLANYLKNRIKMGIVVKQPSAGHTAIMRGAVLYQLGLKVDERVARRHYGLATARLFSAGDPIANKSLGNDGLEWCNNVMKWQVKMDQKIPNGLVLTLNFFMDDYKEQAWNQSTVTFRNALYACDETVAPQYLSSGIRELCEVKVDAKRLPSAAIERKLSPQGFYYYKVSYEVAMHFNTTIEFKVMYNGKEYGSAEVNYM